MRPYEVIKTFATSMAKMKLWKDAWVIDEKYYGHLRYPLQQERSHAVGKDVNLVTNKHDMHVQVKSGQVGISHV